MALEAARTEVSNARALLETATAINQEAVAEWDRWWAGVQASGHRLTALDIANHPHPCRHARGALFKAEQEVRRLDPMEREARVARQTWEDAQDRREEDAALRREFEAQEAVGRARRFAEFKRRRLNGADAT
jgi:hypothetical protein